MFNVGDEIRYSDEAIKYHHWDGTCETFIVIKVTSETVHFFRKNDPLKSSWNYLRNTSYGPTHVLVKPFKVTDMVYWDV